MKVIFEGTPDEIIIFVHKAFKDLDLNLNEIVIKDLVNTLPPICDRAPEVQGK